MTKNRNRQTDAEYVRGGKGRRDEVGKSGVYLASDENAPAGAEVRGQEEFGHGSPRGQALQRTPKEDSSEVRGEGREPEGSGD